MRVINFSDARNQLKQVIDQVVDELEISYLRSRKTRKGLCELIN